MQLFLDSSNIVMMWDIVSELSFIKTQTKAKNIGSEVLTHKSRFIKPLSENKTVVMVIIKEINVNIIP